jgi:hypothetical protein
MEGDIVRWWGGVEKVVGVVGVRVRACTREEGGQSQKIENRAIWLGCGPDAGCRRGWGVLWGNRAPCRSNLTGRRGEGELIWPEGGELLTLGPKSLLTSPSPPHSLPPFSLCSYAPPRDPFVGQVVRSGARVWWWPSRGDANDLSRLAEF